MRADLGLNYNAVALGEAKAPIVSKPAYPNSVYASEVGAKSFAFCAA